MKLKVLRPKVNWITVFCDLNYWNSKMNQKLSLSEALASHDESSALALLDAGVQVTVNLVAQAIVDGAPEAVRRMAAAITQVSFAEMNHLHQLIRERQQCDIGTLPLTQYDITKMRTAVEDLSGRALTAQVGETDARWLLDGVWKHASVLRSDVAAEQILRRFDRLQPALLRRAIDYDNLRIAKILLKIGVWADPTNGGYSEVVVPYGDQGTSEVVKRGYEPLPIHNVRSLSALNLLVEYGADPKVVINGRTVAHAVVVRLLVGARSFLYENARVHHGKEIFSALAQMGVDLSLPFFGHSLNDMAASLPEELRLHIERLCATKPGAVVASGASVVSMRAVKSSRRLAVGM
jgi:hypothetical protein